MGWAWFVEMHLLLGGIHLDFITLVIVIVIMLIVLNLIKASIKLSLLRGASGQVGLSLITISPSASSQQRT